MDDDVERIPGRINPATAGTIGFVGGCLVVFVVTYWTLGWLWTPEYADDVTDVDAKGVVEQLHHFKTAALSTVIALAGGCTCAIYAIGYCQQGLRYSLRTLLLATTLIAVGLGVIAYLAR